MESEQYKNVMDKFDMIDSEIEILEEKIEEFENSIQSEIEDLRKELAKPETKKSIADTFPTNDRYVPSYKTTVW